MELKAAICPKCSGHISTDPQKETMFCPFCGTKYFVQQAINQYNTSIVTDKLEIKDNYVEEVIRSSKHTILKEKEYAVALAGLEKIRDRAADNGEYWWTCLDAITCHFSYFQNPGDVKKAVEYYNKACKCMSLSEEQQKLFHAYIYATKQQAQLMFDFWDEKIANTEMQILALEQFSEYCAKTGDVQRKVILEQRRESVKNGKCQDMINVRSDFFKLIWNIDEILKSFANGVKDNFGWYLL